MNWQTFYLFVFLIGFLLSVVSLVGGLVHFPGFHFHGHFHGHGHVPGPAGRVGGRSGVSPFNFGTIAAFLAWFGGTGYLIERYSSLWAYLGLLIAAISGLGAASVVFWFLLKLMERDQSLDPADYEMVGVLGRVASPIRAGGTGELLYSRGGSRRATPARSDDGAPVPRDAEVIVTRFEKGIAYVRRWEELSGENL
jgi:membrane protein implicated in regulation of membrane protease activity